MGLLATHGLSGYGAASHEMNAAMSPGVIAIDELITRMIP
jgi:hypothetical protein